MSIEVFGVIKKFGGFTALKGINLHVKTGELVALLGPSGSGKTTLLRVIAGLERMDAGSVLINGNDMSSEKVKERNVGFVFQHYALFRHMTVFENVAFGLRVRPRGKRPAETEIQTKVHELLNLVKLDGMAQRYPSQLSGGQRQRVALARALAIEPSMLLLDEPFGALDANVRRELRQWLRKLHDTLHMTSVFVTHDQEEALELADRVVVMNAGQIEQLGTPDEVYHKPATPFVYHFLGNVNLFHCRMEESGKISFGNQNAGGQAAAGSHKTAKVYIRPHLLEIERTPSDRSFRAKVKLINAAGSLVRIEVLSEWGDSINVEMPHEKYSALKLQKEEEIYVKPKAVQIFSDDYAI